MGFKVKKNIFFILALVLFGCSHKEPKVYFNIPLLVGKNIDETRKILRLSQQNDPRDTSITYSNDLYKVDQHILLINYNPKTRKIYNISLIYPDGYVRKSDILKAGNLKIKDVNYRCEIDSNIWEISFQTHYNGVKIYQ